MNIIEKIDKHLNEMKNDVKREIASYAKKKYKAIRAEFEGTNVLVLSKKIEDKEKDMSTMKKIEKDIKSKFGKKYNLDTSIQVSGIENNYLDLRIEKK